MRYLLTVVKTENPGFLYAFSDFSYQVAHIAAGVRWANYSPGTRVSDSAIRSENDVSYWVSDYWMSRNYVALDQAALKISPYVLVATKLYLLQPTVTKLAKRG
jgi:hypothetical protein